MLPLAGAVTSNVHLPLSEKVSGTKRWSLSDQCVTDARRRSVTLAMSAAMTPGSRAPYAQQLLLARTPVAEEDGQICRTDDVVPVKILRAAGTRAPTA